MISVSRILACLAAIAVLCACGTLEERYWQTGVRPEEWAEMRTAIRRVTSSPVTFCSRSPHDPSVAVLVWTADNHSYEARKVRGKWQFTEGVIVLELATPSNQSLQPTALWRCASMSILISVFSIAAQPRSQSGG